MNLLRVASRISVTTGPFPTVTLEKSHSTKNGQVTQTWRVDAEGKSIRIRTFTSEGGHFEFLTNVDAMVTVEDTQVSAQEIIRHIITDMPAKYYPKPGSSVMLDSDFVAMM